MMLGAELVIEILVAPHAAHDLLQGHPLGSPIQGVVSLLLLLVGAERLDPIGRPPCGPICFQLI